MTTENHQLLSFVRKAIFILYLSTVLGHIHHFSSQSKSNAIATSLTAFFPRFVPDWSSDFNMSHKSLIKFTFLNFSSFTSCSSFSFCLNNCSCASCRFLRSSRMFFFSRWEKKKMNHWTSIVEIIKVVMRLLKSSCMYLPKSWLKMDWKCRKVPYHAAAILGLKRGWTGINTVL